MRSRYMLIATTMLLLTAGAAVAFQGVEKTGEGTQAGKHVPVVLRSQMNALGNKFKEKGKERTVFEGLFIDAGGNEKSARISVQKGRKVKLEGIKGQGSVVAFDGEKAKNAFSREDRAFLETYLYDTAEGMFEALQTDASFRLLGLGFGPDPEKNPDYDGPRYDVFDFTIPDKLDAAKSARNRLYYFDSKTHLLHRTVYRDHSVSPPLIVETRFTAWGEIEGSAYPARVERYEDGKRVFTFIATGIESGPEADITNYQ